MVPAETADDLADWFEDQSDSGSLVEYLKTFDLTTAVMQSADGLRRVAKEFVEDLAADGFDAEMGRAFAEHLGGVAVVAATQAVGEGADHEADEEVLLALLLGLARRRPVRVGLTRTLRCAVAGRLTLRASCVVGTARTLTGRRRDVRTVRAPCVG